MGGRMLYDYKGLRLGLSRARMYGMRIPVVLSFFVAAGLVSGGIIVESGSLEILESTFLGSPRVDLTLNGPGFYLHDNGGYSSPGLDVNLCYRGQVCSANFSGQLYGASTIGSPTLVWNGVTYPLHGDSSVFYSLDFTGAPAMATAVCDGLFRANCDTTWPSGAFTMSGIVRFRVNATITEIAVIGGGFTNATSHVDDFGSPSNYSHDLYTFTPEPTTGSLIGAVLAAVGAGLIAKRRLL